MNTKEKASKSDVNSLSWEEWDAAFEAWVAQEEMRCSAKYGKACRAAARELLGFSGKEPWEISNGDVQEWVADRLEHDYYARSPARNPQGPDRGGMRAFRGGMFFSDEQGVRCAGRLGGTPNHRDPNLGFRVVVAPGPQGP